MAKRLLTKSTRYLLIYSVLVLLVAAPALFLITNSLYLEETDETLRLHKTEFAEDYPHFTAADIQPWNAYNRNVKILPYTGLTKDTVFTKVYFDKAEDELEPYRELNGPIVIAGRPYTYQERNNLIEQRDLVMGVAFLFVVVILLMLGGVLLINRISSKRLWRPFYSTLDEMEQIELDKSHRARFGATGIVEFDRLNNSVNLLVEKNSVIYAAQKEFVENAAHELQTPLALFQGKVDRLLQTPLSEEQSMLLEALNTDLGRLNRLNKNLLLLSKIEQGNYPQEDIRPADILDRNTAFFREQAEAKRITLTLSREEGPSIRANAALTEIMLNNLFFNAIRHNLPDGSIAIAVSGRSIVFRNTGMAQPLDPERMFNRFSKADSSGQGTGLGLAIVKRITELHGWTVAYAFDGNFHVFTVFFFMI